MNRPRSEQALLDYLDRLLQPAERAVVDERPHAEPELPEPTPLPVNRARLQQLLDKVAEPVSAETRPAEPKPVAPVLAPAANPAAIASVPEPARPAEAVQASVEADSLTHAGYTNSEYRQGLPASFQALIFRVDELRLALPLYLLGGIIKADKAPTPIVGRPDWLLGLLAHEPANLNVVDTGRYLLGEKYRPDMIDGYQYMIRIGDSEWALACTDLCATRDIGDDDIRWYDSNPRRPWLAGMLKDERCALLNSRALVDALMQAGALA